MSYKNYRTVNLSVDSHQKAKLLSMLHKRPIVGLIESLIDREIEKFPSIQGKVQSMIAMEKEIKKQKDAIALDISKAQSLV